MDGDAAADGAKGVGVEVEGDIEVLPYGRDGGDGGLAEELEQELGLREELVSQVVGELGRYDGEDAEQVGFEGVYGTFGDVATVDIGGHKLVCGLPDVSDVATVLLAGFVIEYLVVNDVAARLEAGHDSGVYR